MKVHDYRDAKRGFGHDCTFEPRDHGMRATMVGWGHGIERGNFILISNPASPSGEAQYRVDAIRYYADPNDMWRAEVSFAPRHATQTTARP